MKRVHKFWKKYLTVVLIGLMLFPVVGCESQKEEKSATLEGNTDGLKISVEEEVFANFLADKITLQYENQELLFSELCQDYGVENTGFLDADNDGKQELALESYSYFCPMIILDVEQDKLVVLTQGYGTGEYLFATIVEGETWLCHCDISHTERELYHLTKYEGYGKIVDEFDLTAEFTGEADSNGEPIYSYNYRNEEITKQDFEELSNKYKENWLKLFDSME